MDCPYCNRVMLQMTANGPSRFTLNACGSCDHRIWAIDGRPASLDDVLEGVAHWGGSPSDRTATSVRTAA